MPVIMSALATWMWAAFRSSAFWVVVAVLLKDVVASVLADVLGMAVNAINSTGFTLPTLASVVDLLPEEMLQIMSRVGLQDCLALIATAYTIRAAVSMVGFVRGWKART